jgi:putative methionine-R-sulfoxide reductase with GAF domain
MQRRAEALIKDISQRMHDKMTKYNWVGFYLVDPVDSGFLVVGPASAVLHLTLNSTESPPDATPRIIDGCEC